MYAFALNCTLKPSPEASSTDHLLDRLAALLTETDGRDQMPPVDQVALVAVVGNEDGAHHVGAELFQGLNDLGFTVPANGMTYWVGEAMHGTDLKDLDSFPDKTAQTTRTMAINGVHLAQALASGPCPSLA